MVIDDHARLALTAMHPDEKQHDAVVFLHNALASQLVWMIVASSAPAQSNVALLLFGSHRPCAVRESAATEDWHEQS